MLEKYYSYCHNYFSICSDETLYVTGKYDMTAELVKNRYTTVSVGKWSIALTRTTAVCTASGLHATSPLARFCDHEDTIMMRGCRLFTTGDLMSAPEGWPAGVTWPSLLPLAPQRRRSHLCGPQYLVGYQSISGFKRSGCGTQQGLMVLAKRVGMVANAVLVMTDDGMYHVNCLNSHLKITKTNVWAVSQIVIISSIRPLTSWRQFLNNESAENLIRLNKK